MLRFQYKLICITLISFLFKTDSIFASSFPSFHSIPTKTINSKGIGVSLYHAKQNAIVNALDHHYESTQITNNKQLVKAKTYRLSKGTVSKVNLISETQRKDGLYEVKIEATVRGYVIDDQDQKRLVQQRLFHPSVKIITNNLNFEGVGFDTEMARKRFVFQLENQLQNSWFEFKESDQQTDFSLVLDGTLKIYPNNHKCGTGTNRYNCVEFLLDSYPKIVDNRTSQICLKDNIYVEDTEYDAEQFYKSPSQTLVNQIAPKVKQFFSTVLEREIQKLDNVRKLQIITQGLDYSKISTLLRKLETFYGITGARALMNQHGTIEIQSLMDAPCLALHLQNHLSNMSIFKVSTHQIHLESR
jgi:hypothetical protein